jgi:hypothetical protein
MTTAVILAVGLLLAQTALQKLAQWRRRVRRFTKLGKCLNKLKSPNPEKARAFLDGKLWRATSNAVERANRRFRQRPNRISRVRTKEHWEQRLAPDIQRQQRASQRQQTLKTLPGAGSKPDSLHQLSKVSNSCILWGRRRL